MSDQTNGKNNLVALNILKCREDHAPIMFRRDASAASDAQPFRLVDGAVCSWATQDAAFGPDTLRARIEPWLTALFQSEHLALLVGSGLTHAIHCMATDKALSGMSVAPLETFKEEIQSEAERSAAAAGREKGNIEDQIRVANELLCGLKIIASTKSNTDPAHQQIATLEKDLQESLAKFAASILEGEAGLVSAPDDKREQAFNYLVSFLMSFASRSGTRDRLQLFTTNYDQ